MPAPVVKTHPLKIIRGTGTREDLIEECNKWHAAKKAEERSQTQRAAKERRACEAVRNQTKQTNEAVRKKLEKRAKEASQSKEAKAAADRQRQLEMARRAAELDADIDRREQRKAQQEAEQRKAHQRQRMRH